MVKKAILTSNVLSLSSCSWKASTASCCTWWFCWCLWADGKSKPNSSFWMAACRTTARSEISDYWKTEISAKNKVLWFRTVWKPECTSSCTKLSSFERFTPDISETEEKLNNRELEEKKHNFVPQNARSRRNVLHFLTQFSVKNN